LFCELQKGVRYCATWNVVVGVGRPQGGRTLLAMPTCDVCQGYCIHQPPKQGCHLQLQVLARCEARLSSQPLNVWAIFGCPKGALGRQKMRCTNLSKLARMAVVFCRWPRFDVGVRGGTTTTVKHVLAIMCWMWTYGECEKNKSHGVQFCRYCNPSLGLATKARAREGTNQEGSLGITFHSSESAKKCEGMNLHTSKWTPILGVGVSMDFRIFRERLQGSKPVRLKFFLYHWKYIETWMSKMCSHDPFGYLKYKLWPKERLGIKLTIWLPITKTQESTWFPYV